MIKYMCKRKYGILLPDEIENFLLDTFEIYEIRGCVGKDNSVTFEIRPNEGKHNNPHVHARYAEYKISIDIITLSYIGDLPNKKMKSAIMWVENNREKLLNDWKNINITAVLPNTKSLLDE